MDERYADVGGVRTYYEEHGDPAAEPVVLLHGGLSTAATLRQQTEPISGRYHCFVPDRRGHGHSPDTEDAITYPGMIGETTAFLNEVVGAPAHLVGYSDGGNLALHLALHGPELVRTITVIGGNHRVDGLMPEFTSFEPEPESDEIKYYRDLYTDASPDGPEHWPVVVAKGIRMLREQPPLSVEDLSSIQAPALIMVGDDDIASFALTVELYESVPNAQLAVIPGASHIVPFEQPELMNQLILAFLDAGGAAPETHFPIRRAAGGRA